MKIPRMIKKKVFKEHFTFDLLEGEDRQQSCNNNQFGKKDRLGPILRRLADQPKFTHFIEGRHPDL